MNFPEGPITTLNDCLNILIFLEQADPKIFKEIVFASRNLPGKPVNIDSSVGNELSKLGLLKEGINYYYLSEIALNAIQEYLGETFDSFKAEILMLSVNQREFYLKFQNFLFNSRSINLTNEEVDELIELGLMIDRSTVHYLVYAGVFQIAIQLEG